MLKVKNVSKILIIKKNIKKVRFLPLLPILLIIMKADQDLFQNQNKSLDQSQNHIKKKDQNHKSPLQD
jgi:hypothetical protein